MAKTTHSITLSNREIPLRRAMVPIHELSFNPENPRVYSMVWSDGEEPDQSVIQARLGRMEHVKQLIQSIKANGGVTDALLIRASDMVVLEGNSRLAAMRVLNSDDSIKWAKVKCDLIDEDIDDDDVFALLVQYHVVGKKDWDPFERAGMFWRRYHEGKTSKEIAAEVKHLGISAKEVTHMVKVYQFMVDHSDINASRWSHYDQYLRSQKIRRAREEHPELDKLMTKKVRSGEIRAVDIRQKLDAVCGVGGKTLNQFISKKTDLDTAYERAEAQGANNNVLNRLQRFREYISSTDVRIAISNNQHTQKCKSELERIIKAASHIKDQLGS